MSQVRRFATSSARYARPIRRLAVAKSHEAIDCMKKDGAVIVEYLASPASVSQSLKDINLYLKQGYLPYQPDDFFEEHTTRATGLIGKSAAYVRDQLMHPLLHSISKYFLDTQHRTLDPTYDWTTSPQVSSCIAFQIDPGARAQILHRDDVIYNNRHTRITSWDELRDGNREATLSMFVAATRSTAKNGATRLIPGSHLWDDNTVPEEDDTVHVELEPGDALFMLSSVYHGGSANTTSEEKRVVFTSTIARGVLRQEENQFLAVPSEVIHKYPEEVQKFAGFKQEFPELGWAKIAKAKG